MATSKQNTSGTGKDKAQTSISHHKSTHPDIPPLNMSYSCGAGENDLVNYLICVRADIAHPFKLITHTAGRVHFINLVLSRHEGSSRFNYFPFSIP